MENNMENEIWILMAHCSSFYLFFHSFQNPKPYITYYGPYIIPIIVVSIFFSIPSFPANQGPDLAADV